jgi:hypothetical protein
MDTRRKNWNYREKNRRKAHSWKIRHIHLRAQEKLKKSQQLYKSRHD